METKITDFIAVFGGEYLCDTTTAGGDIIVTLPDPTNNSNKLIGFKVVGANKVKFSRAIMGISNVFILGNGEVVRLFVILDEYRIDNPAYTTSATKMWKKTISEEGIISTTQSNI